MLEENNFVKEIGSLKEADKRYVLEYNKKVFEADNEQDIMNIMLKGYTEVDDPNMQLLYRIDLARGLEMLSLINDINVDIMNGDKKIKENYAAAAEDPDYEKDYDEADIIIDVNSELTMFSGINKVGYAKLYIKNIDKYELVN